MASVDRNIDEDTVRGFGQEWAAYDQTAADRRELQAVFDAYFAVFPWTRLPDGAIGFDMGCGSGRWARLLAPKVGHLHCIDASGRALDVARMNLSGFDNVTFHHAGVDHIPLDSGSMDFGISLGVLHHVPDTGAGIAECVRVIKPGGALLLYLYYRFDNRPRWFRALWKVTDVGRMVISRLPFAVRKAVTAVIATTVYWPVAHLLALAERAGRRVDGLPLSAYRDKSFYMMRTDALDRFGTRLELRFTRSEIEAMLRRAGMTEIRFSDKTPFWCVSAIKPHHPASSDRTSGSTDTDPVSNPGGRALRAVPARPARRNHRSR